MAYSINPNLPKARAIALKLLIIEGLSLQVVANRCGVHRSTIWRWKQKWLELNKHIQLTNFNRPSRSPGLRFRIEGCKWSVKTCSARPHSHPYAISESIVSVVLQVRRSLKRCAEIIWHHLVTVLNIRISLSSVRRILMRHYAIDKRKKNRVRPDNPERPKVSKPGELVQSDTVHYIHPLTKRRRYIYTVIDIYSRMAHAEVHDSVRPGIASTVILNAMNKFGFRFELVQSDNGSEFSSYFEQTLAKHDIRIRHSRLGRPNDNAHIERFNRTIQDECTTRYLPNNQSNTQIQAKLDKYIDYYNNERIHLGIQMRVPSGMLQRF